MANWWQRLLKRRVRVLPSQAAYALWAQHYPPHAHNAFMAIEEQAMRALLPDLAGKRVLDWACGSGRYSVLAAQQGAQVVGIDNSLPMLRRGTQACLCAEGLRLPFAAGAFDVVMGGLAVGHVAALDALLQELARVLTSSGVLVLSDLHPFQHVMGAQRTFAAADGRVYAVEHYPHFYADYVRAAAHAGLRVEAVVEPQHAAKPVVLAIRMKREV